MHGGVHKSRDIPCRKVPVAVVPASSSFIPMPSEAMPSGRHAFANLSPAECQVLLQIAHARLLLSVTKDPIARRVHMATRHHIANLKVSNIVLQQYLLASMVLFWAILAGHSQDERHANAPDPKPALLMVELPQPLSTILGADQTAMLRAVCTHVRDLGDEPLRKPLVP